MSPLISALVSALIIVVIGLFLSLLSAVVVSRVRNGPATSSQVPTRDGVLFVVCSRRWQRVVLRSVGIPLIVIGCFPLLVAVTNSGGDTEVGAAITAAVVLILGGALVWQAHTMVRTRLEVTLDSIWVFRPVHAPREVALNDIAELEPIGSNNSAGIAVRSTAKRLFLARKLMFGYGRLIDYLQARRPDLAIPSASRPL